MDFASIRVVTDDVEGMVGFYEQATGLTATWYTDDFVELTTPSCTLAIAHTRTIDMFAAGAAQAAANRSTIIEFRVTNVDKEFEHLKEVVSEFVQEPTTMPWGNRSLLFRDPDDNLVNFFAPVSPEAIKKFRNVV